MLMLLVILFGASSSSPDSPALATDGGAHLKRLVMRFCFFKPSLQLLDSLAGMGFRLECPSPATSLLYSGPVSGTGSGLIRR